MASWCQKVRHEAATEQVARRDDCSHQPRPKRVRDRLQNEGAEPIGSTPQEFSEMMRTESKRWADVLKDAAISVE